MIAIVINFIAHQGLITFSFKRLAGSLRLTCTKKIDPGTDLKRQKTAGWGEEQNYGLELRRRHL